MKIKGKKNKANALLCHTNIGPQMIMGNLAVPSHTHKDVFTFLLFFEEFFIFK